VLYVIELAMEVWTSGIKIFHLGSGPKVLLDRNDKVGNHLTEVLPVLAVFRCQEGIEFMCKVARVIDHTSPQFAALPPAVVGRVGAEHQEQAEHDTQKGVHAHGTLELRLMQVKDIQYKEANQAGVDRHEDHYRSQGAHHLTAVSMGNEGVPRLWVIGNHGSKFAIQTLILQPSDETNDKLTLNLQANTR
jgi:hypothetical protein